MKVEFEAVFDKTTKNTVRYEEVGDDINVGTIYIQKSAISDSRPDKIVVSIEDKE